MKRPQHHYQFEGRGKNSNIHPDPYRIIECAEGTVLAIIYSCHGIEFISGYCRKALYDPWGLYCHEPFQRASNPSLTRSWAEPMKKKGVFLFKPTRLAIVKEQDWMTRDP